VDKCEHGRCRSSVPPHSHPAVVPAVCFIICLFVMPEARHILHLGSRERPSNRSGVFNGTPMGFQLCELPFPWVDNQLEVFN